MTTATPTNLLTERDASKDTPRTRGPIGNLGFPTTIKVEDRVYVGAHYADVGGIGEQTEFSFSDFVASLGEAGASMKNLINLRTYYLYEGSETNDVTAYWEKMTDVRLRFLADPGPAATAVRVTGAPTEESLIAIDGIASIGADRQRIMPDHAWDWSIPTPFSQGWRVGDTVFIGGQISADRQGRAVMPGQIDEQTENTLEYIRHVLSDAGHGWGDLVSLRICYQAGQNDAEGRENLRRIMSVIERTIPAPLPTISAFGVDLLYDGLLLEIDGVSVKRARQEVSAPGAQDWMRHDACPLALRAGKEFYFGGFSAPGGASLQAQAEATLDRINVVLRSATLGYENLVKLTIFYVPELDGYTPEEDVEMIRASVAEYIDGPAPVVSIIQVKHLPFPGQRVQIDAVAVE